MRRFALCAGAQTPPPWSGRIQGLRLGGPAEPLRLHPCTGAGGQHCPGDAALPLASPPAFHVSPPEACDITRQRRKPSRRPECPARRGPRATVLQRQRWAAAQRENTLRKGPGCTAAPPHSPLPSPWTPRTDQKGRSHLYTPRLAVFRWSCPLSVSFSGGHQLPPARLRPPS